MQPEPQHLLKIPEYLELDRASEARYEYVEGEIFAMSGASRAHNLISWNLVLALGPQLKERGCEGYTHDMRTRITSAEAYTYPDLVVVCGEPEFENEKRDVLVNPTLVVDVLSPSTEAYDRGQKSIYYRGIPSLEAYLLVAQDESHVELFVRQEDGRWLLSEFDDPQAVLELPAIGARVRLVDIYEGVLKGGAK